MIASRAGHGMRFVKTSRQKCVGARRRCNGCGSHSALHKNACGAYNFGASTIKAQWYKAGKLNGATDTGANMWAVGYDYAMSKRTIGYVGYAKTNNDAQAAFSAFGGGHGDNPGTVKGLDPSGFTVGMIHNF